MQFFLLFFVTKKSLPTGGFCEPKKRRIIWSQEANERVNTYFDEEIKQNKSITKSKLETFLNEKVPEELKAETAKEKIALLRTKVVNTRRLYLNKKK